MGDVSNAYMDAAVGGGLLTLILFIGILRRSFRTLGVARLAVADRKLEFQMWTFCAALCATATAFIGITFFDQSIVIWYALLAMISVITSATPSATSPASNPVPSASRRGWWLSNGDVPAIAGRS